MYIQPNRIISLGYGRYVRSDEIIAVEPIVEGRGPGRRALVWLRGVPGPLTSSRSEEAIVNDLVRPADDMLRTRLQRNVLAHVAQALDEVPRADRRRLRETDGIDLDQLAEEASRALA